jgi:drug/metabolite transporter (DMT)-like permease
MIPAVFQVGFALVIVGAIALIQEKPLEVAWNMNAVVAILWLGIFGSGLAYLANFRLLARIGATRTSILAYFLPIVGLASGAIMFGEKIDPVVLIGTALVIVGIALVNARFGERKVFGRSAPKPSPSEPAA